MSDAALLRPNKLTIDRSLILVQLCIFLDLIDVGVDMSGRLPVARVLVDVVVRSLL